LDWHFCPHCETQLDAQTFICPACRWDPLAVDEHGPATPEQSLVERYRGTQYDHGAWDGAAAAATLAPTGLRSRNRIRTVVLVGFLALVGMYGAMVVYTNLPNDQDVPAATLHR
jgi:hypothetical protein